MRHDLLGLARRLASASRTRPRQIDLKRAVSSAYYALFHALAADAADLFVGGTGAGKAVRAWTHVYRSLEHGFAKNACAQVRSLGFPAEICACADAFVILQQARHDADYDPRFRISRADALAAITLAERAIRDLDATDRKHRRAFAAQLLLRKRF